MSDLWIVSLGWVVFYFLHSWLALPKVKKNGAKMFNSIKNYRLFYSIVSVITLGIVFFLLLSSQPLFIFKPTETSRIVSFILVVYGLIVLKKSFEFFSIKSFFGLVDENSPELNRKGLHQYVRHPIYSGTLLIYLGAFFFNPTNLMLVSFILLMIYLPIGIILEERKLIQEFGEDYLKYKKNVKAIIPYLI